MKIMSQKIVCHLLKNKQTFSTSLRIVSYDKTIVSLLITEMFFRRSFDRFVEYLAWIFIGFICPSKIEKLSIGIAQIQLKHWFSLGYINSLRPSWKSFCTITNPNINYNACKDYLKREGYNSGFSLLEITRLYTGRPRKYYLKIFSTTLQLLKEV